MTKAEELKILEQIEKLIDHAGADSYVRMTFAGVPEICRRNIEDDFGDSPAHDLNLVRERFSAECLMHDETKRQLADSQKMCKDALDENERLRKLAAEWEQNAHDAGELYCKLEDECAEMTAEIRKLKAEIVRMRMARMTEAEIAGLYDKTEGVN